MLRKREGTLWEQLFVHCAMKHGFEVFVPPGDYLPQDVVLMNDAGKMYKVQVKGTSALPREPRNRDRYRVTARSNDHAIDCTKVDVIACYVEPVNVWYLVPCLEVRGKTGLWFYPHNPKSKARLEKFREKWDVFWK